MEQILFFVEILKQNSFLATIIGALIAAISALTCIFITIFFQSKISRDKIKNDNTLKFIDEWFDAEFSERRTYLVHYFDKNPPINISSLDFEDNHLILCFRSTANFFERMHGMVRANRIDTKIIIETIGVRIAYWYVFLVEGLEDREDPEWSRRLGRLSSLKNLCKKSDIIYSRDELKYRRHNFLATRV